MQWQTRPTKGTLTHTSAQQAAGVICLPAKLPPVVLPLSDASADQAATRPSSCDLLGRAGILSGILIADLLPAWDSASASAQYSYQDTGSPTTTGTVSLTSTVKRATSGALP